MPKKLLSRARKSRHPKKKKSRDSDSEDSEILCRRTKDGKYRPIQKAKHHSSSPSTDSDVDSDSDGDTTTASSVSSSDKVVKSSSSKVKKGKKAIATDAATTDTIHTVKSYTKKPATAPLAKSGHSTSKSITNPASWFNRRSRSVKEESVSDTEYNFDIDAWDMWPNGDLDLHMTEEEFEETGSMRTHWAWRSWGGDRKRKKNASTWREGKRQHYRCLGAVDCISDSCAVVIRPHVRDDDAIETQLKGKCRCESRLRHHPCKAKATRYEWSGGVHYEHRGTHDHPKLPHIHMSKKAKREIEAVVAANPKAGALSLAVGGPGRKSVSEISPVLMNLGRIRSEQKAAKSKLGISSSDDFITAFRDFTLEFPNFVRYHIMGTLTVICLQTPFMASLLLMDLDDPPDSEDTNDSNIRPVNGLVSDAAHGYWLDKTALLIISSCYNKQILCWLPVLMTYSDGQSAAHYKLHFLTLFRSIASEAKDRGRDEVLDEWFAGVSTYPEFVEREPLTNL